MPSAAQNINVLTRASAQSPGANDQVVFIVKETVANVPELPAATDIVPISDDITFEQIPDQVVDPTRTSGSRSPIGTITGAFPEGKLGVKFPYRPPAALGGTDKPVGWTAIEGIFGNSNYVNGQAGKAVGSVQAHTQAYTTVRVTAAVTDYALLDCVALRIGAAAGTVGSPGNGEHAYVTTITDAGGGSIDLKLEPGFTVRPTTADFIRGGVTAKHDEDFFDRFSIYGLDGWAGEHASGAVFDSMSIEFSREKLAELMFNVMYRIATRAAEDHIWGDASTDFFSASNTVFKVTDANRFRVGVNRAAQAVLRIITTATGLQSGADERVTVNTVDTTNNTVTLSRGLFGTTALSLLTGANGRLRAITAAGQEVAGPYLIDATHLNLDLDIDNRGWLTVVLTQGAARTMTQIVADINAALAASPLYGNYVEALTGRLINWNTAASVTGTSVRITSQTTGSSSRVRVRASSANDASVTTVGSKVFAAAFDLKAPNEVQILPWNPDSDGAQAALAIAVTPMHMRFGFSKINGFVLNEAGSMNVNQSNKVEPIKDVRTTDPTGISGFIPGIYREPSIDITVDARGWTQALDRLAEQNSEVSFLFQYGGDLPGEGFSVFCAASTIGGVSRSNNGARRQIKFTTKPQRRGTLAEMAAGCA